MSKLVCALSGVNITTAFHSRHFQVWDKNRARERENLLFVRRRPYCVIRISNCFSRAYLKILDFFRKMVKIQHGYRIDEPIHVRMQTTNEHGKTTRMTKKFKRMVDLRNKNRHEILLLLHQKYLDIYELAKEYVREQKQLCPETKFEIVFKI